MEIDITKMNIKDVTIIDIREFYEYRIEHFNNAINVSNDLLELVPEKYLSKDKKYYLYCDTGIKSLELSQKLNSKGYNTHSIKGGFEELKKLNMI